MIEQFFNKLSSYNFINYLIPGVMFCTILESWIGINILTSELTTNVIIYYFTGMCISRIGSIVVEPACKFVHIVKFADYGLFVEAEQKDKESKVTILSNENNVFRSIVTMLLLLLITKAINSISYPQWMNSFDSFTIIIFSLLLLFVFSYRKQSAYVRQRVERLTKSNASQVETESQGKKSSK